MQQQLEGIPPRLVATQHNDHDDKLWHNVLQTDGWFSEKSASIYEASTETLFLGRQDAMQRQSLVPLHRFMQTRSPGRHTKGDNTKMLEVACGTGRFATFVKVLHPTNLPFQTFTPPWNLMLGGAVIMQQQGTPHSINHSPVWFCSPYFLASRNEHTALHCFRNASLLTVYMLA